MGEIIDMTQEFSDKQYMNSVDFQIWRFDRFNKGMSYMEAKASTIEICRVTRNPIPDIERCERVYVRWLATEGAEALRRC